MLIPFDAHMLCARRAQIFVCDSRDQHGPHGKCSGDVGGQFWPVGGLLEAGVVVLRVGVKCWAMPRVREKRWDH